MTATKFEHVIDIFNRIKKNRHFKTGLPFAVFLAGCVYYLTQSQSIKYEFRPQTRLDRKDLLALGFYIPDKSQRKTLEQIYDEIKDKDISQWENKRIPRPWEE